MNGNVMSKEIGDDIKKLQAAKSKCTCFPVVRDAVIRSLRMAEDVSNRLKSITTLLIIVLALGTKVEGVGLIELILKLVK